MARQPRSGSPEPQTTGDSGIKDGTMHIEKNYDNSYVKPATTAKLVDQFRRSMYVYSRLNSLQGLVFSGYYRAWVEDEHGIEDEQLTQELMAMTETQGQRLWVTMQQMWRDRKEWGCGILNDVWIRDGADMIPYQFRRLPPESFADSPPSSGTRYHAYNPILKGMVLDEQENLHLFQTQARGKPTEVRNARIIKDPTDPRLGGTGDIEILIGLLSMGNFTWKTIMQATNRVGAPNVYPRVTKGRTGSIDNWKRAETIAKNQGKDTSFVLTDGIELEVPNMPLSNISIQALDRIEKAINEFWSPKSMLERAGGGSLGESGGAKEDLLLMYIQREHRWIEDAFEEIYQSWLDNNLYKDRTVHILIDKPERDNSTIDIQQAAEGWRDKILSYNEVRERLGAEAISPEDMQRIIDERETIFPAPVMPTFPFHEKHQHKGITMTEDYTLEGEPTEEMLTLEERMQEANARLRDRVIKALDREAKAQGG